MMSLHNAGEKRHGAKCRRAGGREEKCRCRGKRYADEGVAAEAVNAEIMQPGEPKRVHEINP